MKKHMCSQSQTWEYAKKKIFTESTRRKSIHDWPTNVGKAKKKKKYIQKTLAEKSVYNSLKNCGKSKKKKDHKYFQKAIQRFGHIYTEAWNDFFDGLEYTVITQKCVGISENVVDMLVARQ